MTDWAPPTGPPAEIPAAADDQVVLTDREARVIDGFLHNRQEHTYVSYRHGILKWVRYCRTANIGDIFAPTVGDFRGYVAHLSSETISGATVGQRARTVWGLIDHAIRYEIVPGPNRAREVKLPKRPPSTTEALDAQEHADLLTWCADNAKPHEYALVRLLSLEALRRSEARLFRLEHLTLAKDGWVYHFRGKGAVEAWIPVDDETVDAIRAAAAGRERGYLFLGRGQTDKPISERAIGPLVRRLCLGAGVPPVKPHGLRASAVTRAIETEGLDAAQKLARHASPLTTATYYDKTKGRQRLALDAVVTATRQPAPQPEETGCP